MPNLFRKKAVAYDSSEFGLKRCLSALDLTLLGVGAIIGTGIFVLTGHAAAVQSGPAVVLSFIVAGLACGFAALSYAELASSVGGCGSAYGYSYAAFGELIAWIIAWDLILEYGVSVAAVANGWSGYFNNALQAMGFGLPDYLTRGPTALAWNNYLGGALQWFGFDPTAPGIRDEGPGGIINLPGFTIIMMLMVLLIMGVKESARINAAAVVIKLIAVAIFVGVAVFNVNPENWSPFVPFGWFSHDGSRPIGVLAGASIVFFAYVGFDAVSTAVEEAYNPQRDIPIGILAALIFCTLVYVIVSALMTGIVPYSVLNVPSPASEALLRIGHNTAAGLVATGVVAGLTTVMLVLYYALTRIIVGVSRDGLLPGFFATVNAKTQTPIRTTVLAGLAMAIMAGFIPLGILAELVNIGTLAAFVLVCGGVIALRMTHPDMPRPFKTPGGIILPVLGVLSCGALITFLPYETHLRFIIWLALGLVIYFGYSMKRSKLALAEAGA